MDINAKVFAAFQSENKEQLEAIRAILARSPAGGDKIWHEALRLAHTMKAGARVCGFDALQELAHRLETLFSLLHDSAMNLSGAVVETIGNAVDGIEDAMSCASLGQPLPDLSPACAAVDRLLKPRPSAAPATGPRESTRQRVLAAFQSEQREHLAGLRALLSKSAGAALTEGDWNETMRLAHTLKGGARISGLQPIERLSHRLESLFAGLKDGLIPLDARVTEVIATTVNAMEDWMAALAANERPAEPDAAFAALAEVMGPDPGGSARQPSKASTEPKAEAPVAPAPQFESVRLNAEHLDRLLRSSGQLVTESLRQDQVSRALAELSRDIDAIDREWEAVREGSAAHLHRLSGTPEFSRLLHYLEFVERQTRVISRQARQVRAVQQRSSRSVRVLGQELQEDVRKARMMPAENVFGVFRKMMRDVAKDEGKKVEFRVQGLEVQADRMVLQALKDPVMHMLRNAICHGIESCAQRVAAGKAETASVSLRIETVGNRLTIVVEDDGRGLDLARIEEVALRKGLITNADHGARSPDDLAALIFQPGFSTAKAITDLSGRGMGLSVVYEAVSRLQGEVRAVQNSEAGTRMTISVPLSISTHRLLLVSSRGQTFAIPSTGIRRLIRIELRDVETVEGKPFVLWESKPVPLVDLAQILGMEGGTDFAVEGSQLAVMILRSGGRHLAVAVDRLLAEREAIIKNLDRPLADISVLAGGIVLEDGSVALVLNTGELIESFKPVYAPPIAKTSETRPEERVATVLVVDDSFTARTLEKSILEVHGYNVVVAIDGLDALSKLRSEEVDLVISDVQMPRMDGLGLLQEIKKDERFSKLPVILVTSMNRAEDQERGLALGADAYLVKQRFDHQSLLDTIRQLL